ncbi:lysocardiolipin acyltransferase 1 isoform X6 [Apus apus]|uniref:lysocardiolipin acyltransferase 1 isoform X6 n=1 Tax=Apus apus TaxID=8895 RepID=UPI0021F85C19|nr:lysocardiolipin acyltransferase 1 isoform X6 [Apus apus]XP_051471293.1 lysocardiolipin acyltransferase 1 isoform X6 [Apus apus]XP_051471294.1 lysocardiolipin acyltransferase 1 isoform X6 [Apus apus]XP_051471295.1 lysocardiolipin acyltransferase 1 isoform X6 [Apus apus]
MQPAELSHVPPVSPQFFQLRYQVRSHMIKEIRAMVSWKGVYFVLALFLGSFFGSIFMLGPFLPLMFISPAWYRWITDRVVATWLTLPVALLEMVFGAKVVVTGDGFVPGERSVIIMNHRTRMDWMFLWSCLLRYSYLRLEKICLKSSLKSIPGFGWAMQVAAFVFIRRKWENDKSHFEKMLDYFCDIKEPLQLLIFPEGTDLTDILKSYFIAMSVGHHFTLEYFKVKAKCIKPIPKPAVMNLLKRTDFKNTSTSCIHELLDSLLLLSV